MSGTEIYNAHGWTVKEYYNGGAYLIEHESGGACFLQGDDAAEFEREFCDDCGYAIEGTMPDGTPKAVIVLQGYANALVVEYGRWAPKR
jgi:hypothetical protein